MLPWSRRSPGASCTRSASRRPCLMSASAAACERTAGGQGMVHVHQSHTALWLPSRQPPQRAARPLRSTCFPLRNYLDHTCGSERARRMCASGPDRPDAWPACWACTQPRGPAGNCMARADMTARETGGRAARTPVAACLRTRFQILRGSTVAATSSSVGPSLFAPPAAAPRTSSCSQAASSAMSEREHSSASGM